jgi:hypothetical protein
MSVFGGERGKRVETAKNNKSEGIWQTYWVALISDILGGATTVLDLADRET